MTLIPILLLSMSSIVIGGCAEQTEIPVQILRDVSPQEALNLIQDNKNIPDFIIVDVRTPEEFADGYVANAINIDFRSDGFRSEISRLDRDKTYLIYCRSGSRSRGALETMIELGFMEVYHLSTGIIGWLDERLPIIE